MGLAPRQVAVIDVGKTTSKLAVVDRATGETLAIRSRPNAALPGPPYAHLDTDGIWAFLLDGLRDLAARHRVEGVTITAHGATAALMGDDGLAMPVLDYEDPGPESVAAAYDRVRPPFSETLSARLPGGLNVGAGIFWQAQTFPDAFARVRAIIGYPQYWTWRMTGAVLGEVTSFGCHTDLWAPLEGEPSSLVRSQGWEALLPPFRPAASVAGPVRPEVALATGLDAATPVTCGIHDSNASLLPWLGRLPPPFTVVSSGTWTVVMAAGGRLDALDETRDSLANVDAFGRPVPTARFMGGREYALLLGAAPPPAGPADVAQVFAKGIFALPSFSPGNGPFGRSTGRWVGPAASLSAAERTAAADLYLALVTRTCLRLVRSGGPVVIEGPLARNRTFCGLLAAVQDGPVHASPDATGTTLGATMLFGLDGGVGAEPGPVVPPLIVSGLTAYAARWQALAEGRTE